MRHTGAIPQHRPLVVPTRTKSTLTKVARWTLYGSGALAVLLGLIVWPGNVHEVGGAHGLAGWLVVVSLWTLAALSWRAGVPRSAVWLAVGWGLVTVLGAFAQYDRPAGGWITLLHVATGVGAIGWGHRLLALMRRGAVAADGAAQADRTSLSINEAASEFLAKKRIAVTGVSRKATDHGANIVYRRLRERGYEVFAINPNATEVEGDRCFPDLKSIPNGVDAVVIGTRPEHAMEAVRESADLGITHVWMHRSIGIGSVSEEAATWARQRGMRVIAGGCPLMFDPTSDRGHKIMRPIFTLTGKVPRRV